VLSAEHNRRLTEVEGDAPMGQLLRRYWHPIAAVAELDARPTKAVTVFGEQLVLFKDLSGELGLIARRCPHRGADLLRGIPEPGGLRCGYHGWVYGGDGACLEQPFEDAQRPGGGFRAKCATRAYPVRALAGLVWAYLGPAPVPCLPEWDFFRRPTHDVISFNTVRCNWLQCQENSLDPVHFEWLHDYWTWTQVHRSPGAPPSRPRIPRHTRLAFDETEWGIVYRRLREDTDETSPEWTIGRLSLWPNAFYAGGVTWTVPIDNVTSLLVGLTMFPMPPGERAEQPRIPYWTIPTHDPDGEPIIGAQYQQDTTAWEGQGQIADRTAEHLGESDRGIILYRRTLDDALAAVAAGRDPKGVIRDPARAAHIELPDASFIVARPDPDGPKRPVFAGMPEELLPAHLRG
jgi:5,5'-dehydrodivanillate O-demethylase